MSVRLLTSRYSACWKSTVLTAHEGTRWYLTEQGFLVSNSIINAVVEAGE
ncbi:MAG: hypothetical protein ACLR4Z_10005 [Butyricicoccaceae bacterium]